MEKATRDVAKSIGVHADHYQKIIDGQIHHMLLPSEDLVRTLRLEKIGPTKGNDLAVDFGCGEGRNTEFLLNFGYNVLATDVSEAALLATKSRAKAENAQFVMVDPEGTKFPLANGSVSLVVAWEVLHWLGSRESFLYYLREFKRVLKLKDSSLIFTMPTEQHYLKLRSIELGYCQYRSILKSREDCILYAPNLETLKSILDEEGFEIRRLMNYSRGDGSDEDMTLTTMFSMYIFSCSSK